MMELHGGNVKELACEDKKLGWSAWQVERSSRGMDEVFGNVVWRGDDGVLESAGRLGSYGSFMSFYYDTPLMLFLKLDGCYFQAAAVDFTTTIAGAMAGKPDDISVIWQDDGDDWFREHQLGIHGRLMKWLETALDEERRARMHADAMSCNGIASVSGWDMSRPDGGVDVPVRRMAAMSIGFGRWTPESLAAAEMLSKDPDASVRRALIKYISFRSKWHASGELIRRLAQDPDWRVRAMLCHHAFAFDVDWHGDAGEYLGRLADDPEYEVRIAFALSAMVCLKEGRPAMATMALANTHGDDFMPEVAMRMAGGD